LFTFPIKELILGHSRVTTRLSAIGDVSCPYVAY